MPPTNSAAFATGVKDAPLSVQSAPYTSPSDNEVVIKNGAVAINPIDWLLLGPIGKLGFKWLKYPAIFGWDVAGEVVEVGKSVTRFRTGDRVLAFAVGLDEKRNRNAEGAFQQYTVCLEYLTSPIPDSVSYEQASVVPLGLSTAAFALFGENLLALNLPSTSPKPAGKTVLIWGGSTSVGVNAIQLATAAGYEVITTASPKNHEYLKKLGATQTFDYRSKTVIPDIKEALKSKTVAGALSLGDGSADACLEIIGVCKGNRMLAMASFPSPGGEDPSLFSTILNFITWNAMHWFKKTLRSTRSSFLNASDITHSSLGPAIYQDFLPQALQQGKLICAPEAEVVGEGLEKIQHAIDVQKKGVSAKKIVVKL